MGIKRRGGFAPARSSAPARPAPAPAATPARTAQPQHQAPAPQAAPMMAPPQQSGGLLSNIAGGIMQGMTFGAGSAVAHRMVDGIMGPRTVQHEYVNGPEGGAAAAAPAAAAAAPSPDFASTSMMHQQNPASNCSIEGENFTRCLQLNNNMVDSCTTYMSALQQCQRH